MTPRPAAGLAGLHERLRQRRRGQEQGGEDGVALLLTLFVILMVTTLALTFLAVIINETKPTQFERKQVQTIDAAEAGLQVALNQLRTSGGLVANLPCTGSNAATFALGSNVSTWGSTFSGTAGTIPGLTYRASVAYYATNPATMTAAQLSSSALHCPLTTVPAYAYIQSNGLGPAVSGLISSVGNRTVHETYTLAVSNVNIPGGRILQAGSGLCLDAGSNPGVGTTMTLQTCLPVGTPRQDWYYRPDLSIFYEGNPAQNLCIQAPATPYTYQGGAAPSLQPCTGTGNGTTYPYASTTQEQQEWSYNDNGEFAAAADNGDVTSQGNGGSCLEGNNLDGALGQPLVVYSCATYVYAEWSPDATVGAGKSAGNVTGVPGPATNQYVNYAEFGRCLDVTAQNVYLGYLIDYPCKQAPDSSLLTFNQVWTYLPVSSTQGLMYVTTGGTRYCLTSSTTTVRYASMTGCNSTVTAQLWTATGVTSTYATSYELLNNAGQCMAEETPNASESAENIGWSIIVTETCTGAGNQKWNAPATLRNAGVTNVTEDKGGTS